MESENNSLCDNWIMLHPGQRMSVGLFAFYYTGQSLKRIPHLWPYHPSVFSEALLRIRVGVNSGIEWELSSIPDSIPGIGLGIGIEKKGIGIELELTKNARNW